MYPPSGPDGPSSESGDGNFTPYFIPPPIPPRDSSTTQVILFGLTLVTTTIVGGCHYLGFATDMATAVPPTGEPAPIWDLILSARLWQEVWELLSEPMFHVRGLWYSFTILAILGCHEMGHYIACVRYGVDATRPYFLPAPLPLTGTLGAFIRIRSRIPNKTALFDIGIAGPIAGFVVAVPALFLGLWLSRIDRLPPDSSFMMELGEPLLFRFASWMIWGDIADGYSINMHPMAFAAWFGLLATALNLFPLGQLDGGHISYAVLGRRSTMVTLVMACVAVGLTFVSSSWIVWAGLLIAMIAILGPRHPPTLDDEEALERGRLALAIVALLMLIVCFTPAPIGPFVLGNP